MITCSSRLLNYLKGLSLFIILCFIISVNVFAQTLQPENWFDFWVGKWDVSWKYDDGRTGSGTNHVHKILNGKVIEENFKVLDDTAMHGFTGKSLSIYEQTTSTWRQVWVDNAGGYYNFKGAMEGGKRIFHTSIQRLDGTEVKLRMVFYDIQPDQFTWDWMARYPDHKDWNVLWRIHYRRMK